MRSQRGERRHLDLELGRYFEWIGLHGAILRDARRLIGRPTGSEPPLIWIHGGTHGRLPNRLSKLHPEIRPQVVLIRGQAVGHSSGLIRSVDGSLLELLRAAASGDHSREASGLTGLTALRRPDLVVFDPELVLRSPDELSATLTLASRATRRAWLIPMLRPGLHATFLRLAYFATRSRDRALHERLRALSKAPLPPDLASARAEGTGVWCAGRHLIGEAE